MISTLTISFSALLLGLSFNRKHLLSILLCLEGIILAVFLGLIIGPPNLTEISLIHPLILLTLSACEAALGLSLIIATARSHESDNLKTLNLLKC